MDTGEVWRLTVCMEAPLAAGSSRLSLSAVSIRREGQTSAGRVGELVGRVSWRGAAHVGLIAERSLVSADRSGVWGEGTADSLLPPPFILRSDTLPPMNMFVQGDQHAYVTEA